MFEVRAINRNSKEEIELVADRMQKTLIDVMGEEQEDELNDSLVSFPLFM